MKIKIFKIVGLIAMLLLSFFVFIGCSSNGDTARYTLKINIFYDKNVNNGSIFYAILRTDGHKSFINANNQSLYEEYSKDNQNTKFMYINPLVSKKKVTMKTSLMTNQQASIYFLFSNEVSQNWKYRFKALTGDKTFNLYLKGDKIEKVEEKSFSIF